MNIICTIEGCGHLSENREIGLCATHAREARKKSAPKAKPARKRIPKQSEEGKERMEVYMAIRELFMYVHPHCQSHSVLFPTEHIPVSTDLHHRKSREGDYLYDVRYFLSCCRKCHKFLHDNPSESYENGYLVRRTV